MAIIFKPANIVTDHEVVKVRIIIEAVEESSARLVHDEIIRMIAELNTRNATESKPCRDCGKDKTDVFDGSN